MGLVSPCVDCFLTIEKHTFAKWPGLPQLLHFIPLFLTLQVGAIWEGSPQLMHFPNNWGGIGLGFWPRCPLPPCLCWVTAATGAGAWRTSSAFCWSWYWAMASLTAVASLRLRSNICFWSCLSSQAAMKRNVVSSSCVIAPMSAIWANLFRRRKNSSGSSPCSRLTWKKSTRLLNIGYRLRNSPSSTSMHPAGPKSGIVVVNFCSTISWRSEPKACSRYPLLCRYGLRFEVAGLMEPPECRYPQPEFTRRVRLQ